MEILYKRVLRKKIGSRTSKEALFGLVVLGYFFLEEQRKLELFGKPTTSNHLRH